MKYQFMPMFWGDLLANTLHLRTHELGAYIRLIAHAWEHQGKIAVVDLQCVARVSNFHWKRMCPRLAQFFDTVTDPINWIHHRVLSELTKAGEISNKRKDAAMQMHSKSTSKSRANGHANGGHLHLQLPIEMLSDVREASDPTEKPTPAEPKEEVAEKKPVNYRDPGLDYRSPPKTKSDNVLEPIPERPAFRRP